MLWIANVHVTVQLYAVEFSQATEPGFGEGATPKIWSKGANPIETRKTRLLCKIEGRVVCTCLVRSERKRPAWIRLSSFSLA